MKHQQHYLISFLPDITKHLSFFFVIFQKQKTLTSHEQGIMTNKNYFD